VGVSELFGSASEWYVVVTVTSEVLRGVNANREERCDANGCFSSNDFENYKTSAAKGYSPKEQNVHYTEAVDSLCCR